MRANLTNFTPSRTISLTDILTKPSHLRRGSGCGQTQTYTIQQVTWNPLKRLQGLGLEDDQAPPCSFQVQGKYSLLPMVLGTGFIAHTER